jgi:hypothetical protein
VVVEFLAPGRVPSLGVRGDLPLKPGVVYKAFTGISANNFDFPYLSTLVRAAPDSWKIGVEVKRIDFGEKGELLVFFTVLEPMRIDQTQLLFEIRLPGGNWPEIETEQGEPLALPGIKIALEPVSNRRVVERPAAPQAAAPVHPPGRQMSEAEAAKKAAEWLNAPDERGRVVNGPVDTVAAQPAKRPQAVFAAVEDKSMKSNLSRGVVTAPLRAAHVDTFTAESGTPAAPQAPMANQPKVVDFKEETVLLTPQTERAAEPVLGL